MEVAKSLPSTCTFTGYDISPSCFPPESELPENVSFKIQDMLLPFPAEDLGTYDVVAVRFVSTATTRAEWARTIDNLLTLLKPGGWLQWIDSCNPKIYTNVAGVSRKANQEIFDAVDFFRRKEDLIIGMMVYEPGKLYREKVFEERGMEDVHEDVFSTDRLGEFREAGTRNMINCLKQYLEDMAAEDGSGWNRARIERVIERAMQEVDEGIYYTLDQVCIIGRKTT